MIPHMPTILGFTPLPPWVFIDCALLALLMTFDAAKAHSR
jgi:hypothetical protein